MAHTLFRRHMFGVQSLKGYVCALVSERVLAQQHSSRWQCAAGAGNSPCGLVYDLGFFSDRSAENNMYTCACKDHPRTGFEIRHIVGNCTHHLCIAMEMQFGPGYSSFFSIKRARSTIHNSINFKLQPDVTIEGGRYYSNGTIITIYIIF